MSVASENQQVHKTINGLYREYPQISSVSLRGGVLTDLFSVLSDTGRTEQQISFNFINKSIKNQSVHCRLPVDFSFKLRLPFPVGTAGISFEKQTGIQYPKERCCGLFRKNPLKKGEKL
ncbi:MAG: hypothetical protein IJI14_15615 [Anaerolineaceae bacterium]|nr:hypothetical protein [Anaerolineaceae bacterium]